MKGTVYDTEEVSMNIETRPKSHSEVENLVAEDDNARKDRDITETTVENTSIQLC